MTTELTNKYAIAVKALGFESLNDLFAQAHDRSVKAILAAAAFELGLNEKYAHAWIALGAIKGNEWCLNYLKELNPRIRGLVYYPNPSMPEHFEDGWLVVDSGVIKAFHYDNQTEEVSMIFHNSDNGFDFDVFSFETFGDFVVCESFGAYYSQHLKGTECRDWPVEGLIKGW